MTLFHAVLVKTDIFKNKLTFNTVIEAEQKAPHGDNVINLSSTLLTETHSRMLR